MNFRRINQPTRTTKGAALIVVGMVTFALPSFAQGTNAPLKAKDFVHPGLLHTEADFARMKAKVAAKQQPWLEGWKMLTDNPRSQLNWQPHPTEKVIRGAVPGQNVAQFYTDVHAAYQLAVRWKVSGDDAYAKKAIEVLNAWSGTLKEVGGNADRFLAAGIYGYQFANAGEIMRTYSGWPQADFERFQNMMLTVFYPMNHDFLTRHNGAAITNYWANWDLCNMASMEAIGVLCDRRDIYDEAINYFKTGKGNGAADKVVYYVHPGYLGQWQESGRDQGHNTLGIALMGPICETAWNQGDDLYGYDNNRVLAGAEYVAKYNLGNEVPYQAYSWGLGQKGTPQTQPDISAAARGNIRPAWETIINHYVNRKGLAAPYSEQSAAKMRPEGGAGGHASSFDQLGFGTLTFTRDPQVDNPRPTGLTARKSGDGVVLSWWGAAGVTSYKVMRTTISTSPGKPFNIAEGYNTLATDIKDTLTYTDKDSTPGRYQYVVMALHDGKYIAASNLVRASKDARLRTQLKFDEGVGTSIYAPSQPKILGQLNGGATWDLGKMGRALALDGRDGYVSLPEGIVSDVADFSISAWVYLNDNKNWARLFDFGDDRGRYLFLTPRGGNGKPRFATSTVYGYNEQVLEGNSELPTNQWVHIAVTLSGRLGTLYVNGVAVGSNPSMDFPPFQIGSTPRNWIGRSQFPNDPYLNGKVDDFRIYDGALSADQVAALAQGKAQDQW